MAGHMVSVLISLFILIVSGQDDTSENLKDNASECSVSNFKLQDEFNAIRYQGLWYVRSSSRPWSAIPYLPLTASNVQVYYRLRQDGVLDFITGTSVFSSLCDYVDGTGVIPDLKQPHKMIFKTNNIIGSPGKSFPYWVVSTDYDSYAVVYSCWNLYDNGTCDPSHAYIWTLTRKLNDMEPAQQDLLQEVAKSCCVSMENSIEIKHNGKCAFDPNRPPKCGRALLFVVVVGCLAIVFLVLLCCACATKRSAEARRKKMQ